MTLGGPKRFQSKNRGKKIHIFRSLLTIGERLTASASVILMRSSIKSFSQMAAAQFHDSEDDIFCVKTRQQQTAHPSQAGQCSAVGVSRAEKG